MILVNRRPVLRVCTLGGVRDANAQSSDQICGSWIEKLQTRSAPRESPLVAKFVSWRSDPSSILRFTQQYGPLYVTPRAGQPFHIRIDEWRNAQGLYQRLWSDIAQSKSKFYEPSHSIESGSFRLTGKEIWLQVDMLADQLSFELWLLDRSKVKVCGNPSCTRKRYFLARHGKQDYCSPQCVDEMQRGWKRKWWAENRGKKA